MHVVSASFGAEGQSILEKRAIQALGAAGALVGAGSGNSELPDACRHTTAAASKELLPCCLQIRTLLHPADGLEQEFFPAAYHLPNILAGKASEAGSRSLLTTAAAAAAGPPAAGHGLYSDTIHVSLLLCLLLSILAKTPCQVLA